MFGLGPWELTIILIVLIFFFGGKRLGDIGEGLGRSISEFKKAVRHDESKTGPRVQESPEARKSSETRGASNPAGLLNEASSHKEEKFP